MSEGLATLSEIDYTWGRHFANVDRDTYLARRFVPIDEDVPPKYLLNVDYPKLHELA